MMGLKTIVGMLPAPNSFAGLLCFAFFAYILVLLVGWCINSTDFDPDEYHRKLIREKAQAKRERKAD